MSKDSSEFVEFVKIISFKLETQNPKDKSVGANLIIGIMVQKIKYVFWAFFPNKNILNLIKFCIAMPASLPNSQCNNLYCIISVILINNLKFPYIKKLFLPKTFFL
jgi:hypothetical protein